jgi:ABC-type bacteriocin/lantibiotic exporter with double-glycine peptidase domain
LRKYLKEIISLIRPYVFKEIVGIILTVFYAVSVSLQPLATKYLIDNVIDNININKLYIGIILFFIICITQPILSFFKDKFFLIVSENITYRIRKNVFNSILHTSINFFSKHKKGEILSRILNDCQSFSDFITNFFVIYIKNLLSILVALISMFYLSYKISILVLIILLFLMFITYKLSNFFKKLSLNKQRNYDNLCIKINQSIDMIETIKSFTLEKKFIEDFKYINDKNRNDNIKIQTLQLIINNVISAIIIIILCCIYGFGIINVKNNILTIGTVIALGSYFQNLIQPVFELVNSQISIKKIIPIFIRISEFININSENKKYNNNYYIKGNIKIEDLYFNYEDKTTLKDININIDKGSVVSILGEAGAGKSTLINLILGFYEPTKGLIKIDGIDIRKINKTYLRKCIGYIPQNIQLFNDSIFENIRCYDKNIRCYEIVEICKKIGIHKFIISLKKGYNTIISEKINISGGQKQMLAIARAIIKKPKILICDEPTSSLDKKNAEKIKNIISEFKNIYTVIIVTHDISMAIFADNILVLDKGILIEKGSHEYLLNIHGVYNNLINKYSIIN